MQMYEYSVVPLNIGVREGDKDAQGKVTALFASLLNTYSVQGWEYQSFEVLPITVSPGCLGALFGAGASYVNYYCVVFRKPLRPSEAVTTSPPVKQRAPARTAPFELPSTAASASLQRFFYLDIENETQGPVTRSALKKLVDDGAAGYDTLVCLEGGEEWKKLEEFIAP